MSLVLGCIFSFIAVSLGAFGAHGLKAVLDAYTLDIWKTAVLYQMFHALALLALGIIEMHFKTDISLARWGFTFGILIFSGSLYLLALSGMKWLGAITPLGGLAFLATWAYLTWKIWLLTKSA
jgi:uncharacterized membrane protein YgdD (TMEM256/DUF423 family)